MEKSPQSSTPLFENQTRDSGMDIQTTRYTNKELDDFLEKSLFETEQRVIINAQTHAVSNHPPVSGRDMRPYFNEDHLAFQTLINAVNEKLRFKAACNEVITDKDVTAAEVRALHNSLTQVKGQQIVIDARLADQSSHYSTLTVFIAWAAIAVIALFEGILSMPLYQGWGYSTLEALCMALLFAGVIAAFSHLFEPMVRLGKTPRQQRLIATTLMTLLTVFFAFIAHYRAQYLAQQVSDNAANAINLHISMWPFVATSILLFVVSVAVNHFLLPTKAEIAAKRQHQTFKADKVHNSAEQERIVAAIAARQRAHAHLMQANGSMLEYGFMKEQVIMSRAHAAFELWKKHNAMLRPDHARPLAFNDTTYPFNFTTYFHRLKDQQS